MNDTPTATAKSTETKPHDNKPKHSWINLLVDFGPLIVFFLAYKHYAPADSENGIGVVVAVTKGTVAFMAATVVALVVSKWKLGRVTPMVWLSSTLILGFGALTVYFHDPVWIQIKPTAVYLAFAALLLGGLMRGKAMLRVLLQSAFEGLSDEGWMKLSRNWGLFFIALAVLNEVLRHVLTFGGWLQAKVWLFSGLSFLFTFTQLPMVLKHGMGEEKTEEFIETPPTD